MILELGYFVSQAIFLLRTRNLRARAKIQGVNFDDMPEARKFQWHAKKSQAVASNALEEHGTPPATAADSRSAHELESGLEVGEKTSV